MPSAFVTPFAPRRTYDYRPTSRLSDLILAQGQIRAEGERQAGLARAQAFQGIGNAVSRTLGDLVRYREEAPQRELQQQQLAVGRRQLRELEDQDVRRTALRSAQSHPDPATAISQLREMGYGDVADQYQALRDQQSTAAKQRQVLTRQVQELDANYLGRSAHQLLTAFGHSPQALLSGARQLAADAEADGYSGALEQVMRIRDPIELRRALEAMVEAAPEQQERLERERAAALQEQRESRLEAQAVVSQANIEADNARAMKSLEVSLKNLDLAIRRENRVDAEQQRQRAEQSFTFLVRNALRNPQGANVPQLREQAAKVGVPYEAFVEEQAALLREQSLQEIRTETLAQGSSALEPFDPTAALIRLGARPSRAYRAGSGAFRIPEAPRGTPPAGRSRTIGGYVVTPVE